jgi:hypothetical protein
MRQNVLEKIKDGIVEIECILGKIKCIYYLYS